MKNFQSAARERTVAVSNATDLEFTWDGIPMTAIPPTTGQLVLLMAIDTDGTAGSMMRGVMEFFSGILSDADYEAMRDNLREGGDAEVLVEIMEWLIEQWSARPTKRPSASSPSRRTTTKSSTQKPRSTAST